MLGAAVEQLARCSSSSSISSSSSMLSRSSPRMRRWSAVAATLELGLRLSFISGNSQTVLIVRIKRVSQ